MIEAIRNVNRASILDLLYKIKEAAVLNEKEGCRRNLPAMSNLAISNPRIRPRIFLLSPANASGVNGQRLLGGSGESDLALRLQALRSASG